MIKVIILRETGHFEIKEIENDYKTIKSIVGGYIDSTTIPDSDIQIVCKDDCLLDESYASLILPEYNSMLAGTLIFSKLNNEGYNISLTDEDIEFALSYIKKNRPLTLMDKGTAYFTYLKEEV